MFRLKIRNVHINLIYEHFLILNFKSNQSRVPEEIPRKDLDNFSLFNYSTKGP